MKPIYAILLFLVLFSSCRDEELTLKRESYLGNELRIDGYYYHHYTNENTSKDYTACFFLFRNGIWHEVSQSFESVSLDVIDKIIIEEDKWLYSQLTWGPFVVRGNAFESEEWLGPLGIGDGLNVNKRFGIILNDTTIHFTKVVGPTGEFPRDEVYHFRPFSQKPDSTIAYRWIP